MTDTAQNEIVSVKLATVTITTELDAVYTLPDMFVGSVESLTNSENLHGFAQISLVNVSGACLIMPSRIIKTIAVNGEVVWRSRV